MTMCNAPHDSKGFTLFELSVVLVIIGLLVGAVFVGRDLIALAKLRAAVSQEQQYDTAVNEFNIKYNCIPGDCAIATRHFSGATNGNGNGLLDISTSCENGYFWTEMNSSGLVGESPTPFTYSGPRSKLGRGNTNITVGSHGGKNYFVINASDPTAALSVAAPAGVCSGYYCTALQPIEAKYIDDKLDDGMPTTGKVLGLTKVPVSDPCYPMDQTGAATSCADASSPPAYNISNANFICSVGIGFSGQ